MECANCEIACIPSALTPDERVRAGKLREWFSSSITSVTEADDGYIYSYGNNNNNNHHYDHHDEHHRDHHDEHHHDEHRDHHREHHREDKDYAELFRATAEWIALERRCCPFLSFELRWDAQSPTPQLRLRGPTGIKAFLNAELPVMWRRV